MINIVKRLDVRIYPNKSISVEITPRPGLNRQAGGRPWVAGGGGSVAEGGRWRGVMSGWSGW